MDEFELIKKYFTPAKNLRRDVVLGVGDDAALIKIPPNELLVTAVDTLVEKTHFVTTADPSDVGYKALAVNLSDFAAMGATPAWVTLALTIPFADIDWLPRFKQGLFPLMEEYHLQLVGGDTTRGPLTISIQLQGYIPENLAMQRNQAQVGDVIYVTGNIGEAALALALQNQKINLLLNDQDKKIIFERLNRPQPRVNVGLAIREMVRCAIDISDGLIADLSHILTASKVGATIHLEKIPLPQGIDKNSMTQNLWELIVSGGDDYELCFTVSPEKITELEQKLAACEVKYSQIGVIEKSPGLRVLQHNKPFEVAQTGYTHFEDQ